jgi:hypothetical protein
MPASSEKDYFPLVKGAYLVYALVDYDAARGAGIGLIEK